MDKLYLERLYAHYRAGHVNDSGKTSHLLQVAKSLGKGMSRERFDNLAGVVNRIEQKHQSGEITQAEFQDRIWHLPKVFNSALGQPVNQIDQKTRVPERTEANPPVPNDRSRAAIVQASDIRPGEPPAHHSGPPPIQGDTSGNADGRSRMSRGVDALQVGLDAWGAVGDFLVPGTGIAADGLNAGISVGRVFTDPGNAGTHLFNAGVSAISMIPGVGDLAKAFKYGPKAAKAMKNSGKFAKAGARAEELAAKRGKINSFYDDMIAKHKSLSEKTGRPVDQDHINKLEYMRNNQLERLDESPGFFASMGNMFGGMFGGGNGGGGGGGSGGGFAGGDHGDSGSVGGLIKRMMGGGDDASSSSGLGSKLAALKKPINDVIDAFKKMKLWLDQLDQRNKVLLNSFDNIAQVNGQIAVAFDRLEIGRHHRAIEKGQFMGDSVSGLANAQNRQEEARQELFKSYERTGTNLQSLGTIGVSWLMEKLHKIDFISSALDSINENVEELIPKDEAGGRLNQAMDRASKQLDDIWDF